MLPLEQAWVQSLGGELRSHMPCDTTKKKKKEWFLKITLKSRLYWTNDMLYFWLPSLMCGIYRHLERLRILKILPFLVSFLLNLSFLNFSLFSCTSLQVAKGKQAAPLLPKSWLSVHQCQKEIQGQSYGREGKGDFITLPDRGTQ